MFLRDEPLVHRHGEEGRHVTAFLHSATWRDCATVLLALALLGALWLWFRTT